MSTLVIHVYVFQLSCPVRHYLIFKPNLFLPTLAYVLVTPATYENNINNWLKMKLFLFLNDSMGWPSTLLCHIMLIRAVG